MLRGSHLYLVFSLLWALNFLGLSLASGSDGCDLHFLHPSETQIAALEKIKDPSNRSEEITKLYKNHDPDYLNKSLWNKIVKNGEVINTNQVFDQIYIGAGPHNGTTAAEQYIDGVAKSNYLIVSNEKSHFLKMEFKLNTQDNISHSDVVRNAPFQTRDISREVDGIPTSAEMGGVITGMYYQHHKNRVLFDSEIVSISKTDDIYTLTDRKGRVLQSKSVILGVGLGAPKLPVREVDSVRTFTEGIERGDIKFFERYIEAAKPDTSNKRIAIIGGGHSGAITAEAVIKNKPTANNENVFLIGADFNPGEKSDLMGNVRYVK